MNGVNAAAQVVDTFLSHSYAAHEVNLRLYELISTVGEFTFRVDDSEAPTSTTRLERMVRDADAFVAFWSLPGDAARQWQQGDLRSRARYFGLELDMAIRARKPGIAIFDDRFGRTFVTPPEILSLRYDAQRLQHGAHSSAWAAMVSELQSFWSDVAGRLRRSPAPPPRVGVVIDHERAPEVESVAAELLEVHGLQPVRLRWPPRLSASYLSELRGCDWIVADVGDPRAEAMTAFLHGRFVPVLRIQRVSAEQAPSAIAAALYGHHEVGYVKDVVRFDAAADLRPLLDERIAAINRRGTFVGDSASAIAYFQSAAQRSERVFLSYAGADDAAANVYSAELRKRFRTVFDYRVRGSIPAGEAWRDEIIASIDRSQIAVILISAGYLDSKVCMEEARLLRDAHDTGTRLLVVRLDEARPPDVLRTIQYERAGSVPPGQIIDDFLRRDEPTTP